MLVMSLVRFLRRVPLLTFWAILISCGATQGAHVQPTEDPSHIDSMGTEPAYARIQGGVIERGWALNYVTTVVPGITRSSITKFTFEREREEVCDSPPVLVLGETRISFERSANEETSAHRFEGRVRGSILQQLLCGTDWSITACGETLISTSWLSELLALHLRMITAVKAVGGASPQLDQCGNDSGENGGGG